jgi:hypothetical protein
MQSLSEPAFFEGIMRCLSKDDWLLAEKALYSLQALLTVPRNVWSLKVRQMSDTIPWHPTLSPNSREQNSRSPLNVQNSPSILNVQNTPFAVNVQKHSLRRERTESSLKNASYLKDKTSAISSRTLPFPVSMFCFLP